jgi:Flp pilus assembly protein TadD
MKYWNAITMCVVILLFSCGEEEKRTTHVITGNSQFTTQEGMDLNSEGITLVNAGDIAGARFKFEEGLRYEPDNATLLGNLGNCSLVEQDFPTAKSYFLRSIKADTDYVNSIINYARILYEENNDSAVYWNQCVLRKSTDNSQIGLAHLRLAYTAFDNGNCDEATSHYELALDHLQSANIDLTEANKFAVNLESCR